MSKKAPECVGWRIFGYSRADKVSVNRPWRTIIADMKFDLHCHSSASDGKLLPKDVLQRAAEAGLDLFALTDHDTIAGYREVCSVETAFNFVSGIELSAQWQGVAVHIVGLDFDAESEVITNAISHQRKVREERAYKIDELLAKKGMTGVLDGALSYCPDIGQVGRPHFAKAMVDKGYVDSVNKAFDKWLGAGKIGDVKNGWPMIEQAVHWVTEGGGVTVLAHPLRYKVTFSKLRRLIEEFAQVGGHAVEVVGQQMKPDQKKQLIRVVEQFNLAASGGADFHDPDWAWAQIGQIEALPESLTPVWQLFNNTVISSKN